MLVSLIAVLPLCVAETSLGASFWASFGASTGAPAAPDTPDTPPNVVFILCDDLGWGDLGVLFQNDVEGERRLHTPKIDRIAAEGVVLRKHYCPAAVCAPSRASLLTGVHQGHANVRDNQFDKALENNHTLASTLRAAGYNTALIGKWGLQGKGDSPASWPAYPTKRGFDSFYGYVRHRDGHSHYPAHKTRARGAMQVWDQEHEVSADLTLCYTADLFTARAKKFLVERAEASRATPFFLLLAYDTPHAALHVPTQAYPEGSGLDGGLKWLGAPGAMINTASGTIDSWIHPDYRDRNWGEGEERFATMVRRVDDCVGDVVQTLRDLGLAENTLVVFSSDNGPHKEAYTKGIRYSANAFDSFGPFDGIKRDAWEGGLRVPTLAWWPGTIPAGRVDGTPSQFHDWLPTFTEIAGCTTPARTDGVSLLPALTGVGARSGGTVYVEYAGGGKSPSYAEFDPSHRARKRGQEQAIHQDGYKGIRVAVTSHDDPFEIYDVDADPRESKNLAGSSPEFIALERRMRDNVLRLRRINSSAPRPYDAALVPAVEVADAEPGVAYDVFEGTWPWVPDLSLLESVATGTAEGIDVTEHLTRPADAGLLYHGFLDVPTDGLWTFEVESDAGVLLRIHEIQVVDDDFGRSGAPVSGSVRLAAGRHPYRLWYRSADAAPRLALRWSGPAVPMRSIPGAAFLREP